MFSFRETVKVPSAGGKSQKYVLMSQRTINDRMTLTNIDSTLPKEIMSSSMLAKAIEKPQNLYFVR